VSGIGVARDDISDELLELRANLMIESQTFSIMRESQALAGARRITGSAKLQALFRKAESSGMPASVVEAISYLESWGDPKAESPSGPRGIMQISGATAPTWG
jgi:soluble lytic murein transglycosylase-like protein